MTTHCLPPQITTFALARLSTALLRSLPAPNGACPCTLRPFPTSSPSPTAPVCAFFPVAASPPLRGEAAGYAAATPHDAEHAPSCLPSGVLGQARQRERDAAARHHTQPRRAAPLSTHRLENASRHFSDDDDTPTTDATHLRTAAEAFSLSLWTRSFPASAHAPSQPSIASEPAAKDACVERQSLRDGTMRCPYVHRLPFPSPFPLFLSPPPLTPPKHPVLFHATASSATRPGLFNTASVDILVDTRKRVTKRETSRQFAPPAHRI